MEKKSFSMGYRDRSPEVMPHPFPLAMGVEEEIGLIFYVLRDGKLVPLGLDQIDKQNYFEHIRSEMLLGGDSTRNGSMLSASRGNDSHAGRVTNPEVASPETLFPSQAISYLEANEHALARATENYVQWHNGHYGEHIRSARIQRRAIDSEYRTIGIHDNFDLTRLPFKVACDGILGDLMVAHSLTRPFITGAGMLIEGGDFIYSQKMLQVDGIIGTYNSNGTYIYDIKDEDKRLELRSSDPNVLQWASMQRLGCSALIIAMASTPLVGQLERLADEVAPLNGLDQVNAQAANQNIMGSERLSVSIRFQRELAKLALDKLQFHMQDLPIEYFTIANEWLRYVNDFEAYLQGELPLRALANRADWARKLDSIHRSIERDRELGVERQLGDYRSLAGDMVYDMIRIDANPKDPTQTTVRWGYGYQNRRVQTNEIHSLGNITKAKNTAPNTRAQLRTDIIQELIDVPDVSVFFTGWTRVTCQVDGKRFTIRLPENPAQTELDDDDAQLYSFFKAYLATDTQDRNPDEFEFWDTEVHSVDESGDMRRVHH